METINLKTTQKVEVEFSVSVPSYFKSKDEREWLAIINKDTLISLSIIDDSAWIAKQGTDLSTSKDKIREASEKYHSCTESQFIQKYDEVIESISKNTLLEV